MRVECKAISRSGMGIELAVLVLLVVFGCITLLVSSALVGNKKLTSRETELFTRLKADMLLEAILTMEESEVVAFLAETNNADLAAGFEVYTNVGGVWKSVIGEKYYNGSSIAVDDGKYLIVDKQGKPVVSVACDDERIIRWDYH